MQVGQHTSPIACLQHVVQAEGLWGLSRGFRATLCREVPGNALFFTVYEGLRRTWLGGRPGGHGSGSSHSNSSSSSSGGSDSSSGGSDGSSSGSDGSSSGSDGSSSGSGSKESASSLAAAWAIAQDAGGAVLCGGLAGVAVSLWGGVLPAVRVCERWCGTASVH
jgi:hypothetical protein